MFSWLVQLANQWTQNESKQPIQVAGQKFETIKAVFVKEGNLDKCLYEQSLRSKLCLIGFYIPNAETQSMLNK